MIRFVPFADLNQDHLTWIAESALAPPVESRVDASDFLRALMQGTMRLFDWDDGCIVVGKREKRLVIYAFACHNLVKRLPPLLDDMRRLAADWECDAIETTCFDSRMTSAIKKIGAVTESTTIVLPLESDNG